MLKYECNICRTKFDNIKQFINHMDTHSEIIKDLPKPIKKKTILDRLFRRRNKTMAKAKDEIEQVQEVNLDSARLDAFDERLNELQSTIKELTDLIANQQTIPQPTIVPTNVQVKEPEPNHSVKFTILVQDKDSGTFLKELNSKVQYKLENFEVVR